MVSIKYYRVTALLALCASLSACQIGYVANNAYHQARLLHSAQPVQKVLKDNSLSPEHQRKLELAIKAKEFAETDLSLKKTKNYSTYVDLKRPYVTYIVSASPKDELKYYTWYFPIIGHVPYKGYFSEEGAKEEERGLIEQGYDTTVRGVSAYSTLGWFKDPILSSMMSYSDYDLVSTIIHETVHTTLYIKSNANFNERLASYLGDLGANLFFKKYYPEAMDILQNVRDEEHDQKIFGEFMSQKVKALDLWYKDNKKRSDLEIAREQQFVLIIDEFKQKVLPQLKTKKYNRFSESKLNNAKLMGFKLYMNDLDDFEKLSQKWNHDFAKVLAYCLSLEKEADPEKALKNFISTP